MVTYGMHTPFADSGGKLNQLWSLGIRTLAESTVILRSTNVIKVTFIKAFDDASRDLLIGFLTGSSASRGALYCLAILD